MGGTKLYQWNILSAPITDCFIRGVDFLQSKGAVIDLDKDVITLRGEQIPVFIRRDVAHNQYIVTGVSLDRKLVVPLNTVLSTVFSGTTNKFKGNAIESIYRGVDQEVAFRETKTRIINSLVANFRRCFPRMDLLEAMQVFDTKALPEDAAQLQGWGNGHLDVLGTLPQCTD